MFQEHERTINLMLPGEVALHDSMNRTKAIALKILMSSLLIGGVLGVLIYLMTH